MSQTKDKFTQFHANNPHIYDALVQVARRLRDRGIKRYSIAGLFEVVRFELAISTVDNSGFKLGNDYKPHYSRLIMAQEPDLGGMFTTHQLAS